MHILIMHEYMVSKVMHLGLLSNLILNVYNNMCHSGKSYTIIDMFETT